MKLLLAFFLHFIADFILQSRKMGKEKSSNPKYLLAHMGIQFLVFLPFFGWRFAFANAFIHGLIDGNIWRLYKFYTGLKIKKLVDIREKDYREENHLKSPDVEYEEDVIKIFRKGWTQDKIQHFKYWEDHLFYVTIGLDQFLHTATIILLLNIKV